MSEEQISSEYRELTIDEADIFAEDYARAWLDPAMPERQYRRVVARELEMWARGEDVLPYRIALDCLQKLPITNPTILDVGAATGYYSEVFRQRGYDCRYTAVDFSEDFRRIATRLFPGIKFKVCDARDLPFATGLFDVVFHGACIMHIREYGRAIAEAARVSGRFVVFHRTPVVLDHPTMFYAKEAYGVPCLETWFNEAEFLELCSSNGLNLIESTDVFWVDDVQRGHRTYVFEKLKPEPYASNPNV